MRIEKKIKLNLIMHRVIISKIIDVLVLPIVFISGITLMFLKRINIEYLPRSRNTLLKIGTWPIHNSYYEPFPIATYFNKQLSDKRILPYINWNIHEQLDILNRFKYNNEITMLSEKSINNFNFDFDNGVFESGDAEYWYSILRLFKPKLIIEIGSGHSTILAQLAIKMNNQECHDYQCRHICIEPYHNPWLAQLGVDLIRDKVENLNLDLFTELKSNDFLFIDSSHVIRPQGDVLYEYLEIIPSLYSGVIVHAHDIFTPREYPEDWIINKVRLWNEQYLLEAFLTLNREWKVIGALNYLHHNYYEELKEKCPKLTPDREPGSFYFMRTQ